MPRDQDKRSIRATRAPDSSLQTRNNKQPTYKQTIAIWDAKHRLKAASRVSDADHAKFAMFRDGLAVKAPAPGDVLSRLCPPAYRVSALLSNGAKPKEPEQFFLDRRFSIVPGFNGDVNAHPWPSRIAHGG